MLRRTLAISYEAVPPSILPAGAQGGTSARRTGAALTFVSCIRLFGRRALTSEPQIASLCATILFTG